MTKGTDVQSSPSRTHCGAKDCSSNNADCNRQKTEPVYTELHPGQPIDELHGQIRQIESLLRTLEKNDPTFKRLPSVIISLLQILAARGARYNGCSTGVMELVYEFGDVEAYTRAIDPWKRMKQVMASAIKDSGSVFVSDKDIRDLIEDGINYGMLWMTCRSEKAARNGSVG